MKNKIILLLLIVLILISYSCSEVKQSLFAPGTPFSLLISILLPLQKKPSFSPAPGEYKESQTITILANNNLPIRYTLDGRTPSCTVGEIYDKEKKISLVLGKFNLQAVECFENSFTSIVGSGTYNITGTFSYSGLANGPLSFIVTSTNTYNPTGLDPQGVYAFTVTPVLPTCITMNTNTGVLTGTCSTSQASSAYNFTAMRQDGNKEDLFLTANLVIQGWGNEAYLKAPNADASDFFGGSVSVSGDTIVVGALSEDSNQTTITNGSSVIDNDIASQSGAAYVFRRTGTTWVNEAYLKASNAELNDQFGSSVNISGDTIVIGSVNEASTQTTITNGTTSAGNGAAASGAAYVFRRTGTTWANEAYLKAPNADASDFFGGSVSISGDTIVVGVRNEDSPQTTITNGTTSAGNGANLSGAAYVFRRTGTIWANEAYLKAPNAEGGVNGDQFGIAVSISGDTIVVSATGEDSLVTTITNGTLVQSSDNSTTNSGAAYVYRRTGVNWSNEAYLKAPNAEASDNFGISVSISGDTIVVGADLESSNQATITNGTTASADNAALQSGAAYVSRRTGNTWANEAYIKAPNVSIGYQFGTSVSIANETIVVGSISEASNQTTITNGTTASTNNSTSQSGAAYVFKRAGTNWSQEAYLKAPNAEANDRFGISVSVSGDTIVVGARNESSNQTTITNGTTASADNSASNSGAAYVFRLK